MARSLLSRFVLQIMIVMLGVVFLFGNVLWLCERGENPLIARRYLPGVLEAMWCVFAIQSTIGFGDVTPKRWIGRLLAVPMWICGLLLAALITAHLLSSFMSEKNRSGIHSYHDLREKTVITVEGTTAVRALKDLGVRSIITVKDQLENAYARLESGEADAIVFDYPCIADMANTLKARGKEPYVVPSHFDEQMYAIAVNMRVAKEYPRLVQDLNAAIITCEENDTIARLKDKWFADIGIR